MNSLHYQVVYDYSQQGIGAAPMLLAIIILAGLIMGLVGRAIAVKGRAPKSLLKAFQVFMIVWVGIGACAACTVAYTAVNNLASIQQGHVEVVEGVVHDFKAGDEFCREEEQFTVKNVTFKYSCGLVGGFNQTATRGGPIRDGLQVRVTYYGRYIVKLEIAQ